MNEGNFVSSHCSTNIFNLVGSENELFSIIIIIIISIIMFLFTI